MYTTGVAISAYDGGYAPGEHPPFFLPTAPYRGISVREGTIPLRLRQVTTREPLELLSYITAKKARIKVDELK
ncbi:hypothetical protein VTK56DRAFT_6039 [Thermocarpiscus australiensis]